MWDCQVSSEGQMTPLVRRPRSAHGDILNRAARNVAHNLSEQKTSKIKQSQSTNKHIDKSTKNKSTFWNCNTDV